MAAEAARQGTERCRRHRIPIGTIGRQDAGNGRSTRMLAGPPREWEKEVL